MMSKESKRKVFDFRASPAPEGRIEKNLHYR
jgi:hypothetical protein